MNATRTAAPATSRPTPRRVDGSLVGQLNREWARLCATADTTCRVTQWAAHQPALAGCTALADIERRVVAADRVAADGILLALLEHATGGDQLAGRVVLQLMLGKAVRIAAAHTGRAPRDTLEQLAVAALWDVIATYPVDRRRSKVAANLAMDTVHHVTTELAYDRHEWPAEPATLLDTAHPDPAPEVSPQLELYELLAWAVQAGTVSAADASLIVDVYSSGPDRKPGFAIAAEHGLTWAAARQRCSRAIRRLAQAVHHDAATAAA